MFDDFKVNLFRRLSADWHWECYCGKPGTLRLWKYDGDDVRWHNLSIDCAECWANRGNDAVWGENRSRIELALPSGIQSGQGAEP